MSAVLEAARSALPYVWTLLLFALNLAVVTRAITRPNRTPAARVAWVVVVMSLPVVGVLAYLVLGETSIGRARYRRLHEARAVLGAAAPQTPAPALGSEAASLFALGRSITGLPAEGGNRIELLGAPQETPGQPTQDCATALEALIAALEGARSSIHIAFYIWLPDDTGTRAARAVMAAARRGVRCRVMVDALGSRDLRQSPLWREMTAAGVHLLATLDDVSRLRHRVFSRVDLRDHRKLAVIDNRVGFFGSQNCADPAFRVKARFAPWVDVLLRCEGPLVRQLQFLFLGGGIPETGETALAELVAQAPPPAPAGASVAQAFETGPTTRHNAMSDMFVACLYAARRELFITTPYFVPDEAILRAVCAAPRRGVRTTLIVPARCDSWLVAKACRSTYADLLDCGVQLHEYPLGLLHAKTMTVDGELALLGSANIDRRSLELNFENNVLVADPAVAQAVRARQQAYLSVSPAVRPEVVRAWPFHQRLLQDVVGMMAPVL